MDRVSGGKAKTGGNADSAMREELLVQLYYDRADAVRIDAGVARMIERVIARLSNDEAEPMVTTYAAEPDGERQLH